MMSEQRIWKELGRLKALCELEEAACALQQLGVDDLLDMAQVSDWEIDDILAPLDEVLAAQAHE